MIAHYTKAHARNMVEFGYSEIALVPGVLEADRARNRLYNAARVAACKVKTEIRHDEKGSFIRATVTRFDHPDRMHPELRSERLRNRG